MSTGKPKAVVPKQAATGAAAEAGAKPYVLSEVKPAEAKLPPASDPAPGIKPATERQGEPTKPKQKSKPAPAPTRPTAPAGRVRRRHILIAASFLLIVLLPVVGSAWYLYTRSADQYASTVGFSVRKEEFSSPIELLGGIADLSGSTSSDTDILYEFIQSQKLVSDIDAELDLRTIWSRPENDPVFSYHPPGSIEDLLSYWKRMVQVGYDSATGLIEVRVLAFRPEDATAIAQAILDKSSEMINELSAIAREDAIRFARADLDEAVERLKSARQAVTAFRNQYQIVDPEADIQIQVSLLATLQAQLAEALIERELLLDTTRSNDPRIAQSERRVRIIQNQIEEERRKLGIGDSSVDGGAFASVVGEYEGLAVDREFAEQTYTAALANFDAALAEARRQSRYLAAYILPTLSEEAQFPQREFMLAILTMFLFMVWGILVLIYYSLRDRR